jgi:prophage DNA circulation protein
MSYRERHRQAELGGIPLLVRKIEEVVGRRTTSVEYPDRDRPSSQDHGRMAKRWTVSIVVVGENYDLDLAALRTLAETKGPHRWIHPLTGELQVALEGGLRSSLDYGAIGQSEINFQIVESGDDEAQLVVLPQTGAELIDAADAMGVAVGLNLAEELSVSSGGTAWARANAQILSAGVQAGVLSAQVSALANKPSSAAVLIRGFQETASDLVASPVDLVASVRELSAAIFGPVADAETAEVDETGEVDVVAAGARARALVGAMRAATEWTPPEQGEPSDAEEVNNDGAIEQMIALANVAEVVTVLSLLTLDAADTAVDVLEAVSAAIDEQLEAPWTGDELYNAAVDLKAATSAHFRDLAGRLPSVTSYTPADTVPAFLLAFRLYGDVEREPEIVARNTVQDPARVPAGRELQVLGA